MDPYLREYLDFLSRQHPLLALAAIVAGVVFLTQGWKLFKMLIAANAALAGLLIGSAVGVQLNRPHMDVIMAIGFALVFAALVWPLMTWAICLLGALFGAAVGFVLWRCAAQAGGYPTMADYAWAGGAIGLITMALLAFIIFRTVAVVVTSLQGAWLLVSGVGALALAIDGLDVTLRSWLDDNPLLIPIIVLIPGALGFIFQESQFLSLQAKKRKAAMARA